jgi:hypothetical protein
MEDISRETSLISLEEGKDKSLAESQLQLSSMQAARPPDDLLL